MPMIARSPELLSWQKTTCSWSDGPGVCPPAWGPPAVLFSLWGIANTLVTVATLLIPSRLLADRGSGLAYCLRGPAGRDGNSRRGPMRHVLAGNWQARQSRYLDPRLEERPVGQKV